mmetsp:Transcript_27641/g.49319  ORF Transcript_27641/g.49319 Transcript_27641/m.49319 type:complete len:153 (-) Transcript_27641:591-1049(-)|eukprot:CAMPEP_0168625092 /NCGR_PEP_ID=MMETSP0449_2-20121227/9804_1 /TAXON_ID=1082188 /ORGANISM="Strombidium rassoulzadegani, Strain ras09" /LENGTH=152 /DNA_ID=CAMNT_0008666777 /DNA_START=39 /DNA_END=497 /DNA_ORIENTATION=-
MALDLHRDFFGWPFHSSLLSDREFLGSASSQPRSSFTGDMRMDMTERPEAYDLTADMPGLDEKDVKLELKNRTLTIRGESKQESEEKEGEEVVRTSFTQRSFQRSFRLPTDVEEDGISASMDKGVLKLTMPRRSTEASGRVISIGAPKSTES